MKIKVGNTAYCSDDEPIMVILYEQDKINIANMHPEATKYCQYPDVPLWIDDDFKKIKEWMADEIVEPIVKEELFICPEKDDSKECRLCPHSKKHKKNDRGSCDIFCGYRKIKFTCVPVVDVKQKEVVCDEEDGGYLIPETCSIKRKWWRFWEPRYKVIAMMEKIIKYLDEYITVTKNRNY